MRTPSMTPEQAEAELGPRGKLTAVTPDNRPTVRKWLTAKGYSALFVAALSKYELLAAYNSDKGLEAIDKKYRDAQAIMAEGEAYDVGGAAADVPATPVGSPPMAVSPVQAIPHSPPADDAAATLQRLRDLLGTNVPAKTDIDESRVRSIVREEVAIRLTLAKSHAASPSRITICPWTMPAFPPRFSPVSFVLLANS